MSGAATRAGPARGIVLFLVVLMAGLVAYYGVSSKRRNESLTEAVLLAMTHHPSPGGPTLDELLRQTHAGGSGPRWEGLGEGGALPRVRAVVTRGEQSYDYRFDVDLATGLVHTANPRDRELLAHAGASPPPTE